MKRRKAHPAVDALNTLCEGRKRAPSLKALAAFINAHIPDLRAETEQGYCNTDRKVGRLRIPGQGRKGTRLLVYEKKRPASRVVLDHNAAEPYRHNYDAILWIAYRIGHPDPWGLVQPFREKV